MPASPSVAAELVAHSQALRRLAKDLVGRSHADDLVQETALRALRSPPSRPEGLFAWLATVMRRLAANHRRGDTRRRGRESANGVPDEPPSTADEVARRDHVRVVMEALWSLPEPYQTTLAMRYFHDLSPAAIAARSATPLPTVKSRLQRGLDMLRAALSQRDGRDWRAALVPALGLARRSTWFLRLLTASSVSSMSTIGKSVMVAAAGAALVFVWWVLVPEATPSTPAIANGVGERIAAALTADGRPETTSREPVVVAAAPGFADYAQPFAFELHCRVVDDSGMAIGGAQIAMAPPACTLSTWPQATDGDGRVVLTWRARVPRLVMAVGLVRGSEHTSLQQVAVSAGEVAKAHFVAGVAPLPVNVVLDAAGRQVVRLPECSQGRTDCRACHEGMPMPSLFTTRGSVRRGLHPDAVFGHRLSEAPPAPGLVDMEAWDVAGVGLGGKPSQRAIAGRVFGVDGQPVPGARVEVHRPDFFGGGTRTRADGTYRFPWPVPGNGPVVIRAGGGPEGFATRTIEVGDDHPIDLDLFLLTGRALRGRVLAAAGESQNGARVEYVGDPGQDGDVATVAPDGTFAFANLPPGLGRLLLWGVRGEKLPIAEQGAVLPDSGEVLFDLRQRGRGRGTVRVLVRRHDGEAATDAEVRVWQQDTHRGASLDRREDGAFHVHGLVAGFYRVEAGALAGGFVDLGVQWVDGEGDVDLGSVTLPAPATITIESPLVPALAANDVAAESNEAPPPPPATDPDAAGVLEVYALRADIDVRIDDVVPWTRRLQLPAGRFLLLWRQGDAAVRSEVLTLIAGAGQTLRLDR